RGGTRNVARCPRSENEERDPWSGKRRGVRRSTPRMGASSGAVRESCGGGRAGQITRVAEPGALEVRWQAAAAGSIVSRQVMENPPCPFHESLKPPLPPTVGAPVRFYRRRWNRNSGTGFNGCAVRGGCAV